MILFWKYNQLAFDSPELGCLKSFEPLLQSNAIVLGSMENQHGGIPLIHPVNRIELGVTLLGSLIILIPEWPAEIPVHKPHFFGCAIHAFQIKYTIMGNECFEPVVVDAS